MTDARMTRFWLGAREAVAVIEQATKAPSGTVTIPLCGAMRMGDVAEAMGARKMQTIGLRPGERMDEMLLSVEEAPRAVRDAAYITLQPAYTVGRAGGREMGYASNEPARWLDATALGAMVEEARALW
jgi:FlaA1/EpsC-like NDP-sugar epimerase